MDLDVLFLGTAGSVPTPQRGTSATLVRREGDRLLFDCGEGTQRQLARSDAGLVDLDDVFLTHLHADHFLGLPGMLKTFSLRGREAALALHGPRGSRELFHHLRRLVGTLTYEIDVVELGHGDVVTRNGYRIAAFRTDHGVEAIGYALEEDARPGRFDVAAAATLGVPDGPARGALQRGEAVTLADGTIVPPDAVVGPPRRGRKLVLTGDTAPCTTVVDAAVGADLLVHEATFLADERERARETRHSTAAQAALAAQAAGVQLLALTHVSARYSGRQLEEEARQVFEATIVPRDFDLVEIPLPERGPPVHVPRGGRTGRPGGIVSEG